MRHLLQHHMHLRPLPDTWLEGMENDISYTCCNHVCCETVDTILLMQMRVDMKIPGPCVSFGFASAQDLHGAGWQQLLSQGASAWHCHFVGQ